MYTCTDTVPHWLDDQGSHTQICSRPGLSHTPHTCPGVPTTTHTTLGLTLPRVRLRAPITPPKSPHVLNLRLTQTLPPGLPTAAPAPAVSHRVTGGARKLSEAVGGRGASCMCTAEDALSPLSSIPASGELSPCRINNGGCQDLCLLTHQGHVNCSCRGGRILQDDLSCQGERGRREEGTDGGPWA